MTLKLTVLAKRKHGRLDPIFYTGYDRIMEVEYKGYTFYAWACGDIRIYNKKDESEITNGNVDDYEYLTDKDFGEDSDWEWENNNWFEISANKTGSNEFIDLAELANDYDEAYSFLSDEDALNDIVERLEELKEDSKLGIKELVDN